VVLVLVSVMVDVVLVNADAESSGGCARSSVSTAGFGTGRGVQAKEIRHPSA
jgi:hypothetical protein